MAKSGPTQMDAVRMVNRIAGGRDLVLEHFAVFSKFEYAPSNPDCFAGVLAVSPRPIGIATPMLCHNCY
jgi:hypothetical protein